MAYDGLEGLQSLLRASGLWQQDSSRGHRFPSYPPWTKPRRDAGSFRGSVVVDDSDGEGRAGLKNLKPQHPKPKIPKAPDIPQPSKP